MRTFSFSICPFQIVKCHFAQTIHDGVSMNGGLSSLTKTKDVMLKLKRARKQAFEKLVPTRGSAAGAALLPCAWTLTFW